MTTSVLIPPVPLLNNPADWADLPGGDTPPSSWQNGTQQFEFGPAESAVGLNYIGTTELPTTLRWQYHIVTAPTSPAAVYFKVGVDVGFGDNFDSATLLTDPDGTIDIEIPAGTTQLVWCLSTNANLFIDDSSSGSGLEWADGQVNIFGCDTSFNCECEVDPKAVTLAEMREAVLTLSGYAAQAQNPPPGIAELYNKYCDTAQRFIYTKYRALQTKRFFSWDLRQGLRYYGLYNNKDCCAVQLNRYRIDGAWIEDLNGVWWPLIFGIDPTFYTLTQNFGWPNYIDIRQCIEVFPAPQVNGYKLWIKGHFDLAPFTEDDDITTINADPVQNYAIFLAKMAKGAKDATVYSAMAEGQVGELISGAHLKNRYIPGTTQVPVPTPPVMVHFES